MPVITSGGSLINTQSIVNGTIVNEDINAAAAIALTKLAGLIGNPGDFISIAQTTGTTVDVTLDGNTRILVLAKGDITTTGNETVTYSLRQDTVVKDTVISNASSGGDRVPWSLMYSEVPAADTYTIDVIDDAGMGDVANVKIMVIKLRVV